MAWRVFAGTAVGKAHLDVGAPGQDAFAWQVVDNVLCAAVCDGAGSALHGRRGAQALANGVVASLARDVACGYVQAPMTGDALRTRVEAHVEEVRQALEAESLAEGCALCDYAATFVGLVTSGSGGWFIHVGDGVGVTLPRQSSVSATVSPPENGEYANETYFATGADWRVHVRLTPIAHEQRAIALMSDGAAVFVMNRAQDALFMPFVEPVLHYLAAATPEQGALALSSTLDDPRTHAITNDDKTLLIAQWRPEIDLLVTSDVEA